MYSYDARPWLVWLLCVVAGCWLLYEAYLLGQRSAPLRVAFISAQTDTLPFRPDSLLCAQWQTILWYDSLSASSDRRIVQTRLP